MAIWYAQATGNLSALTYDSLPGGGGSTTSWAAMPETDSVEANAFSITIDVVGWTRAGISTLNGGVFTYAVVGDNEITCEIASGATDCLTLTHASGNTLTITGDIVGGSISGAEGVRNNSTGTLNVVGDIVGGSNTTSYGGRNASTGTINVTGNVIGGSASSADGLINFSTGAIDVEGCVEGGSSFNAVGVRNNSTGTITITGEVSGGTGDTAVGVNNESTGSVLITGTLTYNTTTESPTLGLNISLDLSGVSYFKAPGDGPYTLEDTTPQGLFPKQTLFP